jgi:D-alanyl-D-alanine carboxypeptidase
MKLFSFARLAGLGLAVALGVTACRLDGVNQFTLNAVASQLRADSGAPGVAVGWVTSDRIITSVDGVRRADRPERLPPSDRFHLGSNAKAMLATVIAMAVEDGYLQWNTSIADVLTELAPYGAMDEEFRQVKLEDLLAHRSGLKALADPKELSEVPAFDGSPVEQRAQFSAWVLNQERGAEYGTYLYSNAGYAVAAAMLERAMGKSWDELMQGQLFGPLGIKATFGMPAARGKAQPWGHQIIGGVAQPDDPDAMDAMVPEFLKPAGHVSMSARDYGKFVQLHLRALRGRPDLLKAQSFAELHRPRGQYMAGWQFSDFNGVATEEHQGSLGTFEALVIMQPERDRAAVVLINAFGDGVTTNAIYLAAARLIALDDQVP